MAVPLLNAEQLARLRGMFTEYSEGSHYRVNALLIRSQAHIFIRELTALDKLPELSLNDFDQHVWQLGGLKTKSQSFTWHRANQFLAETDPDQFAKMIDSGEISFVGNVSWGSAVNTLRAYAHGRSHDEIEAAMRRALTLLLHQPDPIKDRLRQLKNLGIGFGRNICSGLLMAWNPKEFILYNKLSEQFWAGFDLGFPARSNWVKSYLRYNEFCQALLGDPVLNLQNLIELENFIYWHSVQSAAPSRKATQAKTKRRRKPSVTQAGITLDQLKATKQEMSPDLFRATWGALYDQLVAEERAKTTTDVTPTELGRRAQKRLDEIYAFLRGEAASLPPAEVLCDWIHFCYALELYREAAALLPYVREDEVDPATYKRAKRIAEVCRGKLAG